MVTEVETIDSVGCVVISVNSNNDVNKGLFVMISSDKTFHYYSWKDIAGSELDVASP